MPEPSKTQNGRVLGVPVTDVHINLMPVPEGLERFRQLFARTTRNVCALAVS